MLYNTMKLSIVLVGLVALWPFPVAAADEVYVDCWSTGTVTRVAPGGTQSAFATGLASPQGMACDQAGNLYVACNNGSIQEFAPGGSGSVLTSWGLQGGDLGSLAVDGAGDVYICNGALDVYYPGRTGPAGPFAVGGALRPSGSLAFGSAGSLYVANSADVLVLAAPPGGLPSVYATPPSGYVVGLAFDRLGDMFASLCPYQNTINPCGPIYEYSATGQWSLFASTNAAQLAFDSAGNLYAAGGSEITEYAPDGAPTVFAAGLDQINYIAVGPAPEPATLSLLALGGLALLRRRPRRASLLPRDAGQRAANR
jgi:hypothetical protein